MKETRDLHELMCVYKMFVLNTSYVIEDSLIPSDNRCCRKKINQVMIVSEGQEHTREKPIDKNLTLNL